MLCEMTNNTKVCNCKHIDAKKFDGISLTKEKSKCCNESTKELSNSNTLLSNKTELNQDICNNFVLFFNNSIDLNHHKISSITSSLDKSHLPELDILIFTSSLLI